MIVLRTEAYLLFKIQELLNGNIKFMNTDVQMAIVALIGLIATLVYKYLMRNHPKEIHKDGGKKYR